MLVHCFVKGITACRYLGKMPGKFVYSVSSVESYHLCTSSNMQVHSLMSTYSIY
jgi:hypothetical protein